MTALPRVRTGLLKHPLDKQVLVYDTRVDRVHLLDPTTACVLELLEEGGFTADEISAEIVARLDLAPNPGFLPLALEELRKSGLLDETAELPEPLIDVNRRELLRTVAMTGAAALLIPTVATLTATRGYAQGTAAVGAGGGCVSGAQCTSGNCCNGICSATGCPQSNGAICTANNQCSSNNCQSGICTAALAANCQACTANGDCQSGNCGTATPRICVPPSGTCVIINDPCTANCQCCSGNCNSNKCKA